MKPLFAALLILSAAGSAQAVTEINSCTDIVLAGNAVVTTDLDCTADQLFVSVTPYGVVDLARCAVYSTHNTTIRGSTFNDSLYDGVEVYWNGFSARLRVSDSEASGNGTFGFAGSRVTIKDSKFNDNGEEGLAVLYAHDEDFPASLSVKGCEATGNGIGISDTQQKSTSISGCTITGNSLRGVSLASARANLRDSIIAGNGQAPECSDPETRCADIVSEYAPTLDSHTTCDTSLSWYEPTQNWGVCAMD